LRTRLPKAVDEAAVKKAAEDDTAKKVAEEAAAKQAAKEAAAKEAADEASKAALAKKKAELDPEKMAAQQLADQADSCGSDAPGEEAEAADSAAPVTRPDSKGSPIEDRATVPTTSAARVPSAQEVQAEAAESSAPVKRPDSKGSPIEDSATMSAGVAPNAAQRPSAKEVQAEAAESAAPLNRPDSKSIEDSETASAGVAPNAAQRPSAKEVQAEAAESAAPVKRPDSKGSPIEDSATTSVGVAPNAARLPSAQEVQATGGLVHSNSMRQPSTEKPLEATRTSSGGAVPPSWRVVGSRGSANTDMTHSGIEVTNHHSSGQMLKGITEDPILLAANDDSYTMLVDTEQQDQKNNSAADHQSRAMQFSAQLDALRRGSDDEVAEHRGNRPGAGTNASPQGSQSDARANPSRRSSHRESNLQQRTTSIRHVIDDEVTVAIQGPGSPTSNWGQEAAEAAAARHDSPEYGATSTSAPAESIEDTSNGTTAKPGKKGSRRRSTSRKSTHSPQGDESCPGSSNSRNSRSSQRKSGQKRSTNAAASQDVRDAEDVNSTTTDKHGKDARNFRSDQAVVDGGRPQKTSIPCADAQVMLARSVSPRSHKSHPTEVVSEDPKALNPRTVTVANYKRADCRFLHAGAPHNVGVYVTPVPLTVIIEDCVNADNELRQSTEGLLKEVNDILKTERAECESVEAVPEKSRLPSVLQRLNDTFTEHCPRHSEKTGGVIAINDVPIALLVLVRIVEVLDVLLGQDLDEAHTTDITCKTPALDQNEALAAALEACTGPGGLLLGCVNFMDASSKAAAEESGTWYDDELGLHAMFAVRLLLGWIPPLSAKHPWQAFVDSGGHRRLAVSARKLLSSPAIRNAADRSSISIDVPLVAISIAVPLKIAQVSMMLDVLRVTLIHDRRHQNTIESPPRPAGQKFNRTEVSPHVFFKEAAVLLTETMKQLSGIAHDKRSPDASGDVGTAVDYATASALFLLAKISDQPITSSVGVSTNEIAQGLAKILTVTGVKPRLVAAINELVEAAHSSQFYQDLTFDLFSENVGKELVSSFTRVLQAKGADDGTKATYLSTSVGEAFAKGQVPEEDVRKLEDEGLRQSYLHVEAIIRTLNDKYGDKNKGDHRPSTAALRRPSQEEILEGHRQEEILNGLKAPEGGNNRVSSMTTALGMLRKGFSRICEAPRRCLKPDARGCPEYDT